MNIRFVFLLSEFDIDDVVPAPHVVWIVTVRFGLRHIFIFNVTKIFHRLTTTSPLERYYSLAISFMSYGLTREDSTVDNYNISFGQKISQIDSIDSFSSYVLGKTVRCFTAFIFLRCVCTVQTQAPTTYVS